MFRHPIQFRLCAVFALSPLLVCGAVASGAATVAGFQATRIADLVLLDRGHDAGLRQGMHCYITRGGAKIAEILLVDLRPSSASALIVGQTYPQSIQLGDAVSVKISKTSQQQNIKG